MKIYVKTPQCYATGGVELLHQLVHEINAQGGAATIWYQDAKEDNPTPDEYAIYGNPYYTGSTVPQNSVVVLPEIWANITSWFRHPVIYWESVDNYVSRFENLKPYAECHLSQSEYATQFLKSQGIDSIFVTDYLNDAFLEEYEETEREPIVLYNPAKGYEYTQQIMDERFVPIEGMTREEIIRLMRRSMVYIDLGNHPGKDRIPREAAMCGLCVITGRNGSALYDINIPEKYKIERTDTQRIKDTVQHCLDTFPQSDFDNYRKSIGQEKKRFREGVHEVLNYYTGIQL